MSKRLKLELGNTMWYNIIVGIHPLQRRLTLLGITTKQYPLTEGANNG